jgi:hypothetical protein
MGGLPLQPSVLCAPLLWLRLLLQPAERAYYSGKGVSEESDREAKGGEGDKGVGRWIEPGLRRDLEFF